MSPCGSRKCRKCRFYRAGGKQTDASRCASRDRVQTHGARPTHLVEAGDDFSFPDVPDERSVTGRRPRDAVQVSCTEKQTRHHLHDAVKVFNAAALVTQSVSDHLRRQNQPAPLIDQRRRKTGEDD